MFHDDELSMEKKNIGRDIVVVIKNKGIGVQSVVVVLLLR